MTDTDIETLKEKKELYRKFGVKRKCAVNERTINKIESHIHNQPLNH